jgi:peptide/nickel transport system substrate-binding protein
MMPQFLDPSPPIVANVQFRRAMYHALDRQQMVDTLMHGNATVMSDMLAPNQPQYQEIQARLIPYEYDPRKAAQLIEALGYSKGPGGYFGDASGQRLAVELRTVDRADLGLSTQAVVADYWQRIGVGVDQLVVPAARQFDNEYRATFPAFEVVVNGPFDAAGLRRQHSSSAKTPQSNFVGSATPRYKNAEYDALIERYLVTIPIDERIQIMGQIIYHYWENVVEMPLFSLPQPIPIADRLVGISPYRAPMGSMLGNAHQWDAKS